MNISSLHAQAHDAAAKHERLTRRVRDEAGSHGISALRVKLAQAARDRIKAENALAAAREAMGE